MDNTSIKVDPPSNGKSKKPTTIYDPSGNELDLGNLINHKGSGHKDPFDSSMFDSISDLLSTHGPALSKLFLIVGSGAGTIYNAIRAGHSDGVEIGWLVMLILSASGLIVEFGFAYAWSRKGKHDLAGKQRKTSDSIFRRSAIVMIGDLSFSVAEVAFGVGWIARYWMGIIQPIMAVNVVWLFYRLKGEHPEFIAEQEIVDLRADAKAADIRDQAQEFRLQLAEKKHHRLLEWKALEVRHKHATKQLNGWRFSSQVKGGVKKAIGIKFLGNGLNDRLGKLRKLLPQNTKKKE